MRGLNQCVGCLGTPAFWLLLSQMHSFTNASWKTYGYLIWPSDYISISLKLTHAVSLSLSLSPCVSLSPEILSDCLCLESSLPYFISVTVALGSLCLSYFLPSSLSVSVSVCSLSLSSCLKLYLPLSESTPLPIPGYY